MRSTDRVLFRIRANAHRSHPVHLVRARPTPAMSHTGYHEESQPTLLLRPHPYQHARVIVDAVLRRDRPTRAAVIPAVVDEKFSTASPKGRKIGIHGVDEA